jgi:formylglycine-generating enzyme required for sulfatase activity
LLHQLPYARKIADPAATDPAAGSQSPPARAPIDIPAGTATLGMRRGQAFGWDNEFEEERHQVAGFTIDATKVTNGDFLEFVRAGGYGDESLWTPEARTWKEAQAIAQPLFWVPGGPSWGYRAMFAEIPLPLDWPVYVSHAEASAFARWRGRSLPTEAQFHRAAYGTPAGTERAYPWGDAPPDARHGVFDFERWDPAPVGARRAGDSAFGVSDLLGNGWEWTRTPFAPLAGFAPLPFYPGYSADFFDGKHFVMKGGSPRTAACMLRRSFRNWFQPHYPYVYATFRCVED